MARLTPSKRPTLLLVTDSPVTRMFFEAAIEKLEEYALVCLSNEKETLNILQQTFISFIVIDENTPHLDLQNLCLSIRELNDHQFTPVLVITSHLKKSLTRQLLKAGATDFLREPIEEEDFLHRMEMAQESVQTKQKMQTLQSRLPSMFSTKSHLSDRIIANDLVIKMIENALDDQRNIALLLAGIDAFDHFESKRGEKSAAVLLSEVYTYLQTLMRGQDLLKEQKKGQFLILLPNTTSKAAQFIGENIQEALEMQPFLSGKMQQTHITVSIGLVTLDQEGLQTKNASFNFDRLMQKALECLEKAKKKGNTLIAHASK